MSGAAVENHFGGVVSKVDNWRSLGGPYCSVWRRHPYPLLALRKVGRGDGSTQDKEAFCRNEINIFTSPPSWLALICAEDSLGER